MARLQIEIPKQILFTTEMPVRITDLNYGNHLGHDSLVSLLHEARVRFLRGLGLGELDMDGRAMLVIDLAVRYRAEASCGEVLRINIGAADIRSCSCELLYHVVRSASGATVAVARIGIGFVDRATGKPTTIPPTLLRSLRGD